MLKLFLLAVLLFPVHTFANSDVVQNKETPCATQAFADGLKQHAAAISDAESESTISEWVRIVFADKTVLENVLNCPEVASIEDTETIKFSTIKYKFPSGREVSIQYETQPKVLKQRLLLANKRQLPSSNAQGHNPNLENIAENDSAVWINTNPAWYAIMVVESGSLNHFVGTEKNNTISLDYIIENIDSLYPQGARCTSRSALAEDYCAINRAVHKTVDLEDDSNDYYVAGDIDLRWIAYAEIALDVALTFCTSGGYLALAGITKAARASRALKGMSVVLKNLRKTEAVTKYIKATGKITQLKNSLKGINLAKLSKLDNVKKYTKNMEKIGKLQKEIDKMDKVADAAKIADKTKELDKLKDASKSFEKLDDVKQYNQAMKTTDEIKSLEKQVDSMNKIDDVKKYKEVSDTYSKLHSYRKALRGIKNLTPQRGNVIARTVTAAKNTKKIYKSAKAAMTGGKLIKKGAKLGKASKFST
ncbi:MAG: hypothetical protein IKZ34_03390, partial [Alphaproteobacteria bacterium]|nr:hypothetical protein [Alphaproteobacteria bacterium]